MNERLAALGDALVAEGVRAVFGVSGRGLSEALIGALATRGVPFHAAGHEGSAAIMAGAFGHRTRALGCSLSSQGSGLGNALPGVLINAYEHRAALHIAEALGSATPAATRYPRLDHRAVTRPCTKAYATLGDPVRTVTALAEAALAEIPGPVHLDLSGEDSPAFEVHGVARPDRRDRPAISARRLVERAVRPVVVADSLAARRAWGAQLGDLRVPVFTTFAAKGVVDERRPFAAGVFTGDGGRLAPETRVLSEADLVVGLGLRTLEVLRPHPFSCASIFVDVVDDLTDGFRPAASVTAADPEFEDILAVLEGKQWGEPLVADAIDAVRAALVGDTWLPGAVYARLEETLPDVGCFVADTGRFCTAAEHVWRARSADRFMASANGRAPGAAIPMAIGAALADPSAPVVCATGDGGIRTYVADVRLAVGETLPVLFLLLSDGRSPSWFQAIGAMGCPAVQVKTADDLAAVLERWRWRDGPIFVEAVFDPEPYAAMVGDLRGR